MRVTSGVIMDNYMRDLYNNLSRIDKFNQQLSSGKKFRNPSENPIGVTTTLGMKNVLNANEQYIRNVGQAREWLNNTESVLNNQGDILHRVNVLTVQASNGGMSEEDRDAIAEEIGQLRDEMINLGNSKIGERYLFAGQKTTMSNGEPAPFEGFGINGEINFNGDHNNLRREIGSGIQIDINSNGNDVFKKSIDTLTALEQAIRGNTGIDVGEVNLPSIQDGITAVEDILNINLQERAKIGAKINRLDLTINRLEDEQLQAKELLSNNEDVDVAEAITNLKMQESVYQASLAIGGRIMQPSLVDFIR